MNLQGSVAIVTGASRGIGRAVAVLLAEEGADIVCTARSTDAVPTRLPGTIEETARQVQALGRRALAVACDVSDEAQVALLAERTLRELGRIDLLVNNAAVNSRAPFIETAPKLWDLVLKVNLRGTFLCTKAVLPQMLKQGSGRIINVSSGAATDPEAAAVLGVIPYAVSKAAVEKLTEALALELRPHHIAVNCLRIETAVATEGARLVSADAELPSGWLEPAVAAEALRWLATRDLSYTGRIITIAEAQRGGG
jgi:NAD(P)-dependent dehydrogenase (short-subunit alcohol dehydrogenase family)